MDATIRATCPKCQSALKIPAQWAGQPVKCKKCGAVVRTRPKAAPPPAAAAPATPPGTPGTNGHPVPAHGHAPQPSPFSELGPAAPAPIYNPFEDQPATHDANGYATPVMTGMPPGYPYPVPPGYAPPAGYSYPVPQGYPQPVGYPAQAYPPPQPQPAPLPLSDSGEFKPSEATSAYRGRGRYRRGSGKSKFVWIGISLLLTAGLIGGGVYAAKRIIPKRGESAQGDGNSADPKNGQQVAGGPGGKGGLLANSGPAPRRLLFIHLSNYLYLNPLTSSQVDGKSRGPDITRPAALRLSYELRIPRDKDNDQMFLLSDTAAPPDNRLPMKSVLTGTYEKFFDTSRDQDRILVYYGGHMLAKDGKAYLVPIEGDPDEPASLIPLDDFYAKLKACKATQKVVIWDVCRFNPERGRQRPGSEPMTEELAKALAAVPPGVQAILTSQPGENALEFYNEQPEGPSKPAVVGSNFLAATRYVANKNRGGGKKTTQDDPIPVAEWASALGNRVNEVATTSPARTKQTVKVVGSPPATLVAFNKDEPAARRFEYPPSPKSASPKEVAEIASELALPGIKSDDGESGIANFPFPAEALAPYKADVPISEIMANKDKYPLRVAVLDAYATIRDVWTKNGGKIREVFTEKTSDAVKKAILAEQIFPAEAIPRLERAIVLLEAVEPMRAAEPKRWQAHYDYALAQCKARLAFMNEYDLALGNIRTEVLPPLDEKKGQNGYKLVSTEKMKVKKEAKSAEEAKEIFDKMATDFKGSPWAILAKRERTLSLGLAWQPFNSNAGAAEPPTQ